MEVLCDGLAICKTGDGCIVLRGVRVGFFYNTEGSSARSQAVHPLVCLVMSPACFK